MSRNKLTEALYSSCEAISDKYDSLPQSHSFSAEFEEKMDAIIGTCEKNKRRRIRIRALIAAAAAAAAVGTVFAFGSSGGDNQVGSGWYLKSGNTFEKGIYVDGSKGIAPSQVFGDKYMLDNGSYLNMETGEFYVYVGEEIPTLKVGKYYVDGNTDNPYFEIYPDGTLQKHNFDIEGDLWAAQGDLSGASEENLNSMAELINEEAEFERSRLYYGIKAIYEDAVVIMLNTENDFSQDFYRCYTYESSDEFTDGIGRRFVYVNEEDTNG